MDQIKMTEPTLEEQSSNPLSQPIKNILVVEDSPTQAESLKQVLEMEGLTVTLVTDGPEAIEQAQLQAFDLIVLDVELPTLNGYETCQRLKVNPDTADIPVIMFTAHDRPADTLAGLELGIVDYIPKDAFASAVLVGTIRQINKGTEA
jgi:two-component system sensor histidine kinase/response regulator